MRRGALTKEGSKLLTVWVPIPLVKRIKRMVQIRDTDQSKFIRAAVREKVQRELAEAAK